MRRHLNSLKKSPFTFQLILSYSMILVILLMFGFFFYTFSIRNLKSEVRRQNRIMLNNSMNQFDDNLSFLSSLPRQIAGNSDFVHLANMTDAKDNLYYLSAYKIKNWLTTLIPSYSQLPVASYFVYLHNTDYIISFEYFESSGRYYVNDRMLDPESFELWKENLMNPDNFYSLTPLAPFSSPYSRDSENYYYKMSLEDFSFRKIPADICFELDLNKIKQIFSGLNLYQEGFIVAVNGNSQNVFSISENNVDPASEDLVSLIQNLSYDAGGFSSYRSNSLNMLVTKCQSEYNHWNYYLVQPAEDVFYSLNSFQGIFFMGIVLALLIVFCVIVCLSRKNSRPMTDMTNALVQSNARQEELLLLAKQQEPLLRASYINKILKGEVTLAEELEYIRNYLKLPESGKVSYYVLYCNIYVNKYEITTDKANLIDIATPDYDSIIFEAFSSFFKEPVSGYLASAKSQEHSYALLMCADTRQEQSEVYDAVVNDFQRLHDYLQDQYSIWIFGGIGTQEEDLSFTWKSYQRAKEAIRYTTRSQICCLYHSLNFDAHVYYFPDTLAKQMTNFVTSGNQTQTEELFRVITHENFVKRSLPVQQMDWLFSDIRNTLLKVHFSLNEAHASPDVISALEDLFKEMPSLKLFEDIALELCELFHTDTNENQLIKDIKAYVSENYQDPSLCLSRISEVFSISESYFSYLFKKTTGENFSNYLEKLRMEQAIYMLKNTDIKISDLYSVLGYNNITSFRRAFKKNFGIAPNLVRECEKQGEGS